MHQRRLKIFFDGGCRPNPGRIEAAVVVRGQTYLFDDLGQGGSTDAEWLALIAAIELAQQLGEQLFDLIGDARAVIDQATGKAKLSAAGARAHHARFAKLAAQVPPARIRWIARTQNLAGIALAARHARGMSSFRPSSSRKWLM